jgi:hyaluronoglucosaminidase
MTLDRTEADVEVGGEPATVSAELADASPDAARVTLTAAAPVTVAVPEGTAPGTYEVPVTLTVDGRAVRQTVTVRACPRTGGPDLARGAQAVSSADEAAGFPASSVTDGDAATRWSSPVQDGAWVQVRLERPAAIGRVDLVRLDAPAATRFLRVRGIERGTKVRLLALFRRGVRRGRRLIPVPWWTSPSARPTIHSVHVLSE